MVYISEDGEDDLNDCPDDWGVGEKLEEMLQDLDIDTHCGPMMCHGVSSKVMNAVELWEEVKSRLTACGAVFVDDPSYL